MNSPDYEPEPADAEESPDLSASPRQGAPLLGVQGLSCSRKNTILFRGLEFTLTAGQLLQVEGENGSGKTTLLRALCGFIEPDQGEILWRGVNIDTIREEYLGELHYVAHSNGIKHSLSCLENLMIARAFASRSGDEDLKLILAEYGLGGYEEVAAQYLSSGQRRRLALARLAVCKARLWIVDEPFTSLDEKGKALVRDAFHAHIEAGGIIVMTSHDDIVWKGITVTRIRL